MAINIDEQTGGLMEGTIPIPNTDLLFLLYLASIFANEPQQTINSIEVAISDEVEKHVGYRIPMYLQHIRYEVRQFMPDYFIDDTSITYMTGDTLSIVKVHWYTYPDKDDVLASTEDVNVLVANIAKDAQQFFNGSFLEDMYIAYLTLQWYNSIQEDQSVTVKLI